MYFYVVLCIVCFVTYSVLFVCVCVLNYCHLVATQLQLHISYHIYLYLGTLGGKRWFKTSVILALSTSLLF